MSRTLNQTYAELGKHLAVGSPEYWLWRALGDDINNLEIERDHMEMAAGCEAREVDGLREELAKCANKVAMFEYIKANIKVGSVKRDLPLHPVLWWHGWETAERSDIASDSAEKNDIEALIRKEMEG